MTSASSSHSAPLPFIPRDNNPFDTSHLNAALRFAESHVSAFPIDILSHLEGGFFEPPPDNKVLGPVPARGPPAGLVLHDGHIVAHYGDISRADVTFSVAKSCLSILAGVALLDGLIELDARVSASVDDPIFSGSRNSLITWRMLLSQTSEWEGILFGKADRIDRGREVNGSSGRPKGWDRPLAAPGEFWEYNDVRVNVLGLALLHAFGRPLPDVWKERIADPIGCSSSWTWNGYDNSTVTIRGRQLVSVPGGSHWGGGLVISAEDQARIGSLMLNDGVWKGTRILPEGWVSLSTRPVSLNPDYGFMWWLNERGTYAATGLDAFLALGAGGNVIWIEPSTRMVAVFRWIDTQALPEVMARIEAARKV